MSRAEKMRGAVYAVALLWVNAYICREWFFHPTAHMQTLDGAWSALARLGNGWFHPSWWPFWDCGMPYEFASAPLVPALARAVAAWSNVPHQKALQSLSAAFYCTAPLALFLLAWLLTRSPGYSFLAGALYSLFSPAQLLAPEGRFTLARLFDAHRFHLQAYRDQTPRAAALTFLLLFIFFLARSIERRRRPYYAAAAASLTLALLATPFSILLAGIAAVCLLATLRPESLRTNLVLTAAIAAVSLAVAAPFFPPSLWFAAASSLVESSNMAPFTALAAGVAGWLALTTFLPRWASDWRTQFVARFAWLMSCGPIAAAWLSRQSAPQSDGLRMGMEPAVALAAAFAIRPWAGRLPRPVAAALLFVALSLAGEQVVHHRKLAKDALFPADVAKTPEYRAALRLAGELPGGRVMLPDSMALWANAFTESPQLTGSDGTWPYNSTVRLAAKAVYHSADTPRDVDAALAWLKALGAAAVVMPRPGKFDAILARFWNEGEATAYRVPLRNLSLAHVVPEGALVTRLPARALDTVELNRYVAALDDPELPYASFERNGNNSFRVRTVVGASQAISVQVSHHPGWHALVNGSPAKVQRDGLGLIWLRPHAPGAATVEFRYDGGWELRLCRWLSLATLAAACVFLARGAVR